MRVSVFGFRQNLEMISAFKSSDSGLLSLVESMAILPRKAQFGRDFLQLLVSTLTIRMKREASNPYKEFKSYRDWKYYWSGLPAQEYMRVRLNDHQDFRAVPFAESLAKSPTKIEADGTFLWLGSKLG